MMADKSGYIATTKFLIASPTKVRPVANVIKRKTCSEAMAILENMPQKGAKLIRGTLKSAISNALFANKKLDEDLKKLNSTTCCPIRYEFFYDREFNADNYTAYKIKYPEINIIKFETLK